MTFRTRTFLGVVTVSAIAFGVATVLVTASIRRTMLDDIRGSLAREARLAGELLGDRGALPDPDAEADEIGRLINARVTFLDAAGRVIGDSEVAAPDLGRLENHATREEVTSADGTTVGLAVRQSQTTHLQTMYAAVRVQRGPIAIVRLALPLTQVEDRVAALRRQAWIGLGAGLVAALVMTWLASVLLSRRVHAIAGMADRYRRGDFSRPAGDFGHDEIGTFARVLDATARELGGQLTDMARERAHRDAILHGMVEGVILIDRLGKLVLINPAVRNMLHLTGDATGRHYLEVVRHPEIGGQLTLALAGDHPAPAEVRLDRDGRRVFVAQVVPVAAEWGGGAVLVLHDVTEMRRADQVRRDFVANVSHELRTPLTAIRGYVEALLDGSVDADQSHRFLEIVARHTGRMERLVRDLLRLARLDAGQETLDRAACNLTDVIAGAAADLQAALDQRDVRVDAHVAASARLVTGDSEKLQDVLRNLIENAINYSPDGGVVDVTAVRAGAEIEIAVADRGPGIPEAELVRIFERFYRVDRSRTRDPGGTGLGLSIVRHLIELHGGRVAAAAREGGGARVTVWLPAPPQDS